MINTFTPLISLDGVAIDTETTGLDGATARLVEIGATTLLGAGGLPREFESRVNPGIPIPPSSTAIHGLADADVDQAPSFNAIAEALVEFVAGRVLIGHTIGFDAMVIARECQLIGRRWNMPPLLDLRPLARLTNESLADYSLDALCDWLDIRIDGRHSAIGDARAAAAVFAAIIPRLRDKGIRTLAEALAASHRLVETEYQTSGKLAAMAGGESTPRVGRIDAYPYRHGVAALMSTPPVSIQSDATIRDAIALMLGERISSLFVERNAETVGVVTDRDMLRAIHGSDGRALDAPVEGIMSSPVECVDVDAFLYRAIGRMDRLGFRHLGVSDKDGNVVGALSVRDLVRHRSRAAIMLGDEIASADGSPTLGRAWAKLPLMVKSLLAEDVDAHGACAIISTEICALTHRAAEIAERRMLDSGKGSPPVSYAVLVLGSGGRGESLLAADQDNAIVYAGQSEGNADPGGWFQELGRHMADVLDEVGVPYCKGGVMAMNADWCRDVAAWQERVVEWVGRQRPEDLLNVDIFFDACCVHGEHRLADTVMEFAYQRGSAAKSFVALLAENARRWIGPLTVFGRLRTDDHGRVDVKAAGLLPISTSARAVAIRHDIRLTSTPARLRAFARAGHASEADCENIVDAHRIILGTLLEQQLVDIDAGVPPGNKVEVDRLSKSDRAALKKAITAVSTVIDLVREGRL